MDEDTIERAFASHGVAIFMPPEEALPEPPALADLIGAALRSGPGRYRASVIALLIAAGEPASREALQAIVPKLDPSEARWLRWLTLAAGYLTRVFRSELTFLLGRPPRVPDCIFARAGLPEPDDEYGETGLRALAAELASAETPMIDWYGTLETPARDLMAALWLRSGDRGVRRPITRQLAEAFLQELGRHIPIPARLVITGGAAMILRGLRGETLDIDVSYRTTPENDGRIFDTIGALKEQLDISIELADPGQFIPMPRGRDQRMSYIGRFGGIDAFLDDPYAIALAKLQRGHERDYRDIRLLAAAAVIDYAELEAKVREIAASPTPSVRRVILADLLARLSFVRET